MITLAKRIIEIGVAFALIYTAVIWVVFEFAPGFTDIQRIYGALQWWFPGIFMLLGVVTLLTKWGERRFRLIFGVSTIYGATLLYISIGDSQFVALFLSFVVGALLVTGLTLLLIRPSVIDCPHCAAANPEKHEFCFKCGNKLKP